MPNINPFVLFFASIFTSNILLSNFLGMCSFISISKSLKSSNGLGMAVTMVMTIATVLNWIVEKYIIVSFNIEYLRYIVYIVVIASVVQILEMVIDRVSPNLYISLGIFLPLITVNCAILGVVLFMQLRNYSLIQSVFFGLGSGIGWWLAIVLLAAIRIKVDKAPVPAPLKGVGITLITIGIMAMAFIGFAGMINVQ
ncbi:electron transport complex protein RnfA [Thermosipho melanesiensis]|uniref:Ion-translocating oxidoreductase complex subunit A n=2 Tax=Thermosipho melanesiensis TaxID=46541 RepID=A6LKR2_THEM4|nr:Rnf-Nqr domain containing protein [Thermosipho melanesiensis]ABR30513.1 RnfA-Nqr electron transport subunit [Thermosipho melanesiensis BI429]